jgi:hypothetical protein
VRLTNLNFSGRLLPAAYREPRVGMVANSESFLTLISSSDMVDNIRDEEVAKQNLGAKILVL